MTRIAVALVATMILPITGCSPDASRPDAEDGSGALTVLAFDSTAAPEHVGSRMLYYTEGILSNGDTVLVRSLACETASVGTVMIAGETYRIDLKNVGWEHDSLSPRGVDVVVYVDGKPLYTSPRICEFRIHGDGADAQM